MESHVGQLGEPVTPSVYRYEITPIKWQKYRIAAYVSARIGHLHHNAALLRDGRSPVGRTQRVKLHGVVQSVRSVIRERKADC